MAEAQEQIYFHIMHNMKTFLSKLDIKAENLTVTEKQQIVRSLVKEVQIDGGRIHMIHSIPLKKKLLNVDKTDKNKSYRLCLWSNDTTLRRTGIRCYQQSRIDVAGFEKLLNEIQQRRVTYPYANEVHKVFVADVVEKPLDVGFDNVVDGLKRYQVVDLLQCLMSTPLTAKPVGTGQKILFVDALKYPRKSTFHNLVLKCGYAQRPPLCLILRNVDPAGRFGFVALTLQLLHQSLKVLREILPVLFPAYPINSSRLIPVKALVAIPEKFSIQQVSKARKLKTAVSPGMTGYEGEFPPCCTNISVLHDGPNPSALNRQPLRVPPSLGTQQALPCLLLYYELVRLPQ
jgi:hypothetical protein